MEANQQHTSTGGGDSHPFFVPFYSDNRAKYVLTYINIMLIHIKLNSLRMSRLFCNFAT